MMNLNQELTRVLENEGCTIFGFADLRILPKEPRKGLDTGIIMGASYTAEGMWENLHGDSGKFARDGGATFEPLERYTASVIAFLKEKKYRTSTTYRKGEVTDKTVGTLSGLGWIAKCALLATREIGPALRLSVVLTNAPLECGTPITKSLCPPDCTACADICPTKAIKGGLWERGIHRDEFFRMRNLWTNPQSSKNSTSFCVSMYMSHRPC